MWKRSRTDKPSHDSSEVQLLPGDYRVIEDVEPVPETEGFDFVSVVLDEGCSSSTSGGPIQAGEERECQIINTYHEVRLPPPD
ncbi:MAG: hypothetical protein GEU26_12640 [Nitrososphaeraceae archaeon]|nr:hypothetical protein [Nitrososphaeraceae archaeon]